MPVSDALDRETNRCLSISICFSVNKYIIISPNLNFLYMAIILNILISGLAVAFASYLTPGAYVDGYMTAIIVAVVLAVVNSTIGPILKLLTFPLNVLTLGLMSLVINVLMVLLVAKIIPGFTLDGFWSAFVFAIILALVNMILGGVLVDKK